MNWSAQQYTRFEQERTRPVRDLVAAIATEPVRVAVDLGCGPGNSTEVLAQRFPTAQVTGVDSADDMLAAARQRLPQVSFELADITNWAPDAHFDVILANASLQWLPDHQNLYPRLVSRLHAGGALAVQTPDNLQEPAHRLLREVAGRGPWAQKLSTFALPPRHDAAYYYRLLKPYCSQVDVWRTTYYHALPGGPAAVVEWFKGSALAPYLARLGPDEQQAFLAQYQAAIGQAYGQLDDGTVLLPFPRLFMVATR
ncbi:trans-aconitate 2-methyltransferase [Pseudomonas typographi]|uniref:Trans-aconitate 2-methyltransferase n=1 Tax=Pseudomonas typographi TaxID=2715964 RepID=A0ABR7YWC7_9PSED|nr:trans-aconitate 2-methyltransferase [Pseudomonas typographi]MBD1585591.1 trans-aconitate 2-methyltransferase [Pseudomonas typographi]MBD1597495.1 trans-aconitate 2-methyltransferase [Pseudomonas typographi]